jgi:hypothetical protein
MLVQVKIDDSVWEEFIKLGEKNNNIHQITESALINHINKRNAYKRLLQLEGNAKWEGNIDKLRWFRVSGKKFKLSKEAEDLLTHGGSGGIKILSHKQDYLLSLKNNI